MPAIADSIVQQPIVPAKQPTDSLIHFLWNFGTGPWARAATSS